MLYKGINLGNVKLSNRSAILQLLNRQGAMSRKDIAEAVGLTPASVTLICNELLEEHIIKEVGEVEEKRAGRKKILVSINEEYRYVLCIGIEANETYISVTNFLGQLRKSKVLLTDSNEEPESFFKRVADECKMLLWESEITREQILAIGVSVPGKVDTEKGISLNSYSIWEKPVPIKALLEKELGLTVYVENNVKAYARMEIMYGAGRSDDNVMLLKWGPGVGAAIIIHSELYQGGFGNAAEIGHVISNRGGIKCKCGREGCLETEISTHAIIDSIKEAYGIEDEGKCISRDQHEKKESADDTSLMDWLEAGNELSYYNTSEWACIKDDKLQKLLLEKIDRFAFTIRNVVGVIDPEKIVVCGYLFEVPGFFEAFIEAYCKYDSRDYEKELTKEEAQKKKHNFFVKSELMAKTYHTEALSAVIDHWLRA